MKNAENEEQSNESIYEESFDGYNVEPILDKIEFLKFNNYDELKTYADDYPIYIQTSDNENVFAIGELYISDSHVSLFYQLNSDKTFNRFDGNCTFVLHDKTADDVKNIIGYFNETIANLLHIEQFSHSFYSEAGAPIPSFDDTIYDDMLAGKVTYALSIIDEKETYWYATAKVIDGAQIRFEFFRCFDLSVYNDNSPNVDLRVTDESATDDIITDDIITDGITTDGSEE